MLVYNLLQVLLWSDVIPTQSFILQTDYKSITYFGPFFFFFFFSIATKLFCLVLSIWFAACSNKVLIACEAAASCWCPSLIACSLRKEKQFFLSVLKSRLNGELLMG